MKLALRIVGALLLIVATILLVGRLADGYALDRSGLLH